jgi:hypothetical protein
MAGFDAINKIQSPNIFAPVQGVLAVESFKKPPSDNNFDFLKNCNLTQPEHRGGNRGQNLYLLG